MSNRLNLPLLGDKALELAIQRRKKNKATIVSSGERAKEIVEASSPPTPKNPRKKRDTDADPANASDQLVLDVSPSGCARSDFSQMSKEFKKLVLEGDRSELKKMGAKSLASSHFRKCFESMQEAAILEEEIAEYGKRESAHKAEKRRWLTERDGLVSQVEKFSQEKVDWEATLLARDEAAQRMKEEHEAAVALFEEQLMEVRIDTEIKTMGRAAQLYEEHYPRPWDVSRYKADLAELERLNAEMNTPTEGSTNVGGSSLTHDD